MKFKRFANRIPFLCPPSISWDSGRFFGGGLAQRLQQLMLLPYSNFVFALCCVCSFVSVRVRVRNRFFFACVSHEFLVSVLRF